MVYGYEQLEVGNTEQELRESVPAPSPIPNIGLGSRSRSFAHTKLFSGHVGILISAPLQTYGAEHLLDWHCFGSGAAPKNVAELEHVPTCICTHT